MLSYSDVFERELRKIIEAEIDRLLENIGHGMGVADYSHYMKLVGEISSFRRVLELCDEARSIANQQ
jgi:predicted hydrocarbon binding protein